MPCIRLLVETEFATAALSHGGLLKSQAARVYACRERGNATPNQGGVGVAMFCSVIVGFVSTQAAVTRNQKVRQAGRRRGVKAKIMSTTGGRYRRVRGRAVQRQLRVRERCKKARYRTARG